MAEITKTTVHDFRVGAALVGDTPARLIEHPLPDGNMKGVLLKAPGLGSNMPNSESVYIGSGSVSIENGFPIAPGESITIPIVSIDDLYAVSESGSQVLHWLLV